MTPRPTPATIRTLVDLPVDLPDGRTTTALAFTFDGLADGRPHLALGFGDPAGWAEGSGAAQRPTPVRVHSECLTGDVFGSGRCDCGPQLSEAIGRLEATGGLLLYLRQEGRGIGLYAKLDAYALQDTGLDTFEANVALGFEEDGRDYTVAAQMLQALGVERIELLTNNPDKASQLAALGVDIAAVVPTGVHVTPDNVGYLATKASRAHTIDVPTARARGRH